MEKPEPFDFIEWFAAKAQAYNEVNALENLYHLPEYTIAVKQRCGYNHTNNNEEGGQIPPPPDKEDRDKD